MSFTIPDQKTFQSFKRTPKGLEFSRAFNELKGFILGCLHLSVHLRIAFLLVAVQVTHHHTATTARCMLGIRLECGPKWMVGRCPHSLHNPSLRLSSAIDLKITTTIALEAISLLSKRMLLMDRTCDLIYGQRC